MNNAHPISLRRGLPKITKLARVAWLLLLLAVVGAAIGCGVLGTSIAGSGKAVTKEYDLNGFSKLSVGNAFQVRVAQAPTHSVALTVDDNLVEFLDVAKSGDTLHIRLRPNINVRNATMKASVAMPELTSLDLSGAVHGNVTGFNSDKALDVEVSGASHLRGDIKNGDARLEASGASKIELRGSAGTLKASASGASTVNLAEYKSGNTVAEASGASHVTVAPSGILQAEASGASSVKYGGEPTEVKAQSSGASSVRKK